MTKRRGKTRIIGMVAVWTGMSLLAPLHPIALTTSGEDAQIPTRAVAATSEEVQDWMPDAKLRQSVQLALGLADENEITKESMRQLTTLENINASSLIGLEYAVNLRSIKVGYSLDFEGKPAVYKSTITDFSPLYRLHNLQSIGLSGDFSSSLLGELFSHVSTVTGILLYNNAVLQDLNWMAGIPPDHTFGFTLTGGGFYGDEVQVTDFSGLDNRSLYGIVIDSPNIKNIPLSTIDPNKQVRLFHGQVSDYSRLGDMKLVDISAQDIRHVPAKIVGDRVIAKNPILLPEGFPAMKAGHFRNYFNSFDEVKQELSISVERLLYINQPHFTDTFGYSYLRDGKTFNAGGAISMDIEGLPVTVRYTDMEGTSIHADTTLTGLFTEPYTSTAVSVPGYTLKTSPANATGTYSEKAQTVTYVYEKIATGPVTAQYVDEQGVSIAPTEVLSGDFGKAYTSKAQHIAGYVLIETPTNATGVFTEQAQTVTYVYHKQTAQPVTVQYVDESGASIASQEVLTGEFGQPYTSKGKKLTGYVLTETPANATGVFTEQAQTVIYVYHKQTAQPVTVQYVDESGTAIAPQDILTGNFGQSYTSKAKVLSGYVLTETPTNATGVFTDQAQTVRYRYQKIAVPAPDTDPSPPDTSTNGPGGSITKQPSTTDTNSKGTTLAPSATTQRQAIPPVSEVPVAKKAIETLPSTGDKNASSGILVAGISSLLAGVWLLRRRS
ncbi:MucBP domain-containing protein [Listeria booriae]|uniref:LPXTG cell wall anchor domain-containing protein n=1 Tax=Listeria booriae TaxID=1552123 RepID=A0A7X0WFG2_9LIST|nr:MucBP domain-containing protein [Listeria booriae]MBC1307591.1 LPXTG cell wall anchor domain-containing protein [Listeria booriae]MBC1332839.1 LPXTG cell wall anchor domain-containing protein [Listeria booriae]MBC2388239.1 LPXTG cell wall anchor domain-containing protein [Listeria booriae]